jgi:hypothetical protein
VEGETSAELAESSSMTSGAIDAVAITEGDAAETAPVHESTNVDRDVDVSDVMSEVLPGDDAPLNVDTDRTTESDEADDQLAMFGVVRPTDPEPVKARRPAARRPRKSGDVDTTRPKRTRKTPTARSGSRRTR